MNSGIVTVALHVGKCLGMIDELANAYTGWNEHSPSRILIREAYPPQGHLTPPSPP